MKHEPRNNQVLSHDKRPSPGAFQVRQGPTGIDPRIPYAGTTSHVRPGFPGGQVGKADLSLTPSHRYRSLLVPVDGSMFAEHALPLALGIARRAGSTVRLVQVHSPMESAWGPNRLYRNIALDGWLKQHAQAYLDDLARRLAKVTPVPVTPLLLEGRDVARTLSEAASVAADLVVMAAHRRSLLGQFWYGSVADALVRQVTAPLLLVNGSNAPIDLTGDPAPQHVLIPVDGSEGTGRVLRPALDLGALLGARRTVLRIVRREADPSNAHSQPDTGRPAWEKTQAQAWKDLSKLVRRLKREGIQVHPRLLVAEESIAASILWYARQHEADLIALETRGRGPLSRLFRGSVANKVAQQLTKPILLVRTGE